MFKKILFNSIFESLLKQGGNAVKGVDRIKKQNIDSTTQKLLKILNNVYFNLKWNQNIFYLGSTGKKKSSGDIDIGIDFNWIKKSNDYSIMDALKDIFIEIYKSKLCTDIVINSITNDMLHIAFPQYNQNGKKLNKFVQIDILFTKYPAFCKFYMYSPSQIESKYKGAHRNDLLRAIIYCNTYKPLKKIGNEVVQWQQYDLNSNGLYFQKKTLVDQNGKKLKYKDTDEDLIPLYAKNIFSIPKLHDPKLVIKLLVGDNYSEKDIDTFEKLFNIIETDPNFKYNNIRYEILQQAAKSIKENNKLVFPQQLIQYLNE